MTDPDLEELVRTFIEVCKRVEAKGFVAAFDGNISARLPNGNILATPTSMNKGDVTAGDLVEITPDGARVAGKRSPSSELKMHLFIYENRKDVNAVVHCHPVHATAFAAARTPLTANLLPEVVVGLGKIPLAPYATPSTGEVSESISPFVREADAVMLSNHGVVTYGKDLWDAYYKMEKVEQAARIESIARSLGGAVPLSSDDVAKLRKLSGDYREKDGTVTAQEVSGLGDGGLHLTGDEIQTIVDEVKKRLRQTQ